MKMKTYLQCHYLKKYGATRFTVVAKETSYAEQPNLKRVKLIFIAFCSLDTKK